MTKLFNSKYPIIEAAMNQGSTLDLAVAVHQAGAFPSISSYCYRENGKVQIELLDNALTEFYKQTGSRNLIVSFEVDDILIPEYRQLLTKHSVSHLEFVPFSKTQTKDNIEWKLIKHLLSSIAHKTNSKVMYRSTKVQSLSWSNNFYFDGMFSKGAEAAGVKGELSTKDMFIQQRNVLPSKVIIPTGGIGTPAQVKEYIDLGAQAVVIGTLLAASQESPLHIDAKKAIVAASSTQLSVFPELNQNALKFSDLTQPDDSNHTLSLKTGAYYNPGKSGHLFIGAGVDFVKDIRPVKEIIEYLVSEL